MKDSPLMKSTAMISFAMLLLMGTAYESRGDAIPSIKLIDMIGDGSKDKNDFQLHIPTDVAMDGKRRIYVVNAGNHQILLFDQKGEMIKSFGVKGSNPSEFYYPYSIDIDLKGGVYISDLGNNRIQCFDRNGTFQSELQFTTGNLRLNDSGDIPVTRAHGDFDYAVDSEDTFSNDSNVQILSFKGEKKHSLSEKSKYNHQQMDIKGNEVYVDFDDNGNLVVVYAYSNLMEKYDSSGKRVWRKEHLLNFEASRAAKNEDQTRSFQEVQMNKCHAGIAVDEKGRIWVATLDRQLNSEERVSTDLRMMRGFDGKRKLTITVSNYAGPSTVNVYKIDVFDTNGNLISSIPLTHFADNIRIFGNDLFIVDSYHQQRIYHYEITD